MSVQATQTFVEAVDLAVTLHLVLIHALVDMGIKVAVLVKNV